ncbi:hypothetical protein TNCV_2394411 [Trichonephila clavipes]|nr:hypothetical protein TNCV_2394411 [Trichonephila clavipes]
MDLTFFAPLHGRSLVGRFELMACQPRSNTLTTKLQRPMSESSEKGQQICYLTQVGSRSKIGISIASNPRAASVTRGHGTTPLRVKEDIEDVFSELGNGD